MNSKWLGFKFVSSFILLVVTTIWTIIYESSVNYDLWFCIWALCLVRFVDVVDEISDDYEKAYDIVDDKSCSKKCGVKND